MSPCPLVSIVMPVRNEEQAIAVALESALGQSYPNIEVLVVDGCSEDGTARVVEEVGARDPRVRLLHNPRRVIPSALNVGLAAARGEYVVRLDGHATVDRDYIACGVRELGASPDVAAVGGRRLGTARTPAGRSNALALSSRFGVGGSINHYGTARVHTDHASFGVYRACVARAVGGWDEALLVNEDVDFDHRIRSNGHRILYQPAMEIHWHVRETAPDLFRQYRRYGRGKAAMVRKNGPQAMRLSHLAAPLLVALVAGAAGLALTGRPRAAAVATAPYVLGVVAGSAACWRRRPRHVRTSASGLPAAFAAMHGGWGIGFLEGLVAGMPPADGSVRHVPRTVRTAAVGRA